MERDVLRIWAVFRLHHDDHRLALLHFSQFSISPFGRCVVIVWFLTRLNRCISLFLISMNEYMHSNSYTQWFKYANMKIPNNILCWTAEHIYTVQFFYCIYVLLSLFEKYEKQLEWIVMRQGIEWAKIPLKHKKYETKQNQRERKSIR